MWRTVRLRVKGGSATPQPPVGPTIAQLGLDVNEVINEINKLTEHLKDIEVTVLLHVDTDTKNYRIEVKSPPSSALLLKIAGASEPSGDPAHKKVGNVSIEDVIRVALMKKNEMNSRSLKAAVKSLVSTASTIGLSVEGKSAKEIIKLIDEGFYDSVFLKYEDEWRSG